MNELLYAYISRVSKLEHMYSEINDLYATMSMLADVNPNDEISQFKWNVILNKLEESDKLLNHRPYNLYNHEDYIMPTNSDVLFILRMYLSTLRWEINDHNRVNHKLSYTVDYIDRSLNKP